MNRSNALDLIRGMAILMVVAYHLIPHLEVGRTGVDLFFVLSGFLVGGILIDNRNSGSYYRTFFARRFFRIWPLYLLLLFLVGLLCGLDQPLWQYLLFLQTFDWLAQWPSEGFRWMVPTWSLAVEEQFYLFLPFLIRIVPPRRLALVAIGIALIAPIYRLVVLMSYPPGLNVEIAYALLPGRLDSLFFGLLAACIVRSPKALALIEANRRSLYAATAIGLAGMLGCFSLTLSSWVSFFCLTWFAATYTLALLALVTQPQEGTRGPLCSLGAGAYSIYLFHLPLLMVCAASLGDGLGARLLTAVLSLSFAAASWHLIESPLIRWARRWQYQAPALDRASAAITEHGPLPVSCRAC